MRPRVLATVLGTALAVTSLAGQALAGPEVWVTNGDKVSAIPTDGAPVSKVFNRPGACVSFYCYEGIVLDPARGKAYWLDLADEAIRVGNLDGTGTPTALPGVPANSIDPRASTTWALTIDPTTQRLYWMNGEAGHEGVYWVATDGSASGGPLFGTSALATNNFNNSLAADPTRGRLWWVDTGASGAARWADLSGADPTVHTLPTPCGTGPNGILGITPPSGSDAVWFNGAGFGKYYFRSAGADCQIASSAETTFGFRSQGLAIDDTTGRAYAVPEGSPNPTGNVGWFSLADTTNAATLASATSDYFGDSPAPALLLAPVAGDAAVTPARATTGSALTCAITWRGDQPNQRAFRAPETTGAITWQHNGVTVAGATGATYMPAAAGTYTCRQEATNAAGTTTATSAASEVSAGGGTQPVAPVPTLKATTRLRGRTFTTRGTVPRAATVVRIAAVSGKKARTGSCRITRKRTGSKVVRTFACIITLRKGAWSVSTTASAGATPVARATRAVRVRR